MKVRTRLIFLQLLFTGMFITGVVVLRYWQSGQISELQTQRAEQVHHIFDSLLELEEKPLYVFCYDYSCWDEMVSFVSSPTEEWADINLKPGMETFHVEAVWVLKPDYSLVYSANCVTPAVAMELPVTGAELPKIFAKESIVHFFVNTPAGLMEIRGASIHPSLDKERKTAAQGYFLVGRLWDAKYLQELSRLAAGTVYLSPLEKAKEDHTVSILSSETLQIVHAIRSWDGVSLYMLHADIPSPITQQVYELSEWQFRLAGVFSIILVLWLFIGMAWWLAAPLRRLSLALQTGNTDVLERLRRERSEFGRIAQLIAQFFDQKKVLEREIADRIRIEQKLHATETSYKVMIDATVDCIFLIDIKGNFITANRAVYEISGLTPEELSKKNIKDYILPDRLELRKSQIDYMVQTGHPLHFEVNFADRFFDVSARPIRGQEGNVTRIAFFAHDNTERREMERHHNDLESQIRQSQRLESVGRLAGGIAHDFNNLLSPILGYSELLLSGIPRENPAYVSLEQIRNAAKRARELTRQLLAFSRKQVLEIQSIDLNMLISETEVLLQRVIGEDVQILSQLASDLRPIKADASQIQQIILNLAFNARDAMPHGGVITMETGMAVLDARYAEKHEGVCPGQYVLLAFRDTGQGMSSEIVARIFEPFYTTKPPSEGTGLGLAMVYGIVRQHGGHIRVDSEPGKGTTFYIYLPPGERAVQAEEQILAQQDARGSETILVAEDDAMVRRLTCDVLNAHGYTLLSAETGEIAIDLSRNYPQVIQLLLTDIIMPRMNGKELYTQLVQERPGLKVVYMSGYTGHIISQHGILEPGTHFLPKPFTVSELLGKIRTALDAPEEIAKDSGASS